LTNEPRVVVC